MRLIDADALKRFLKKQTIVSYRDVENMSDEDRHMFEDMKQSLYTFIDTRCTVDAVPVKNIEQLKWERDTAIEQLEEHGISFGCKADVVAVVRCKDCRWYDKSTASGTYEPVAYRCVLHQRFTIDVQFCSDGERGKNAVD